MGANTAVHAIVSSFSDCYRIGSQRTFDNEQDRIPLLLLRFNAGVNKCSLQCYN
jgi:hypothetical protein